MNMPPEDPHSKTLDSEPDLQGYSPKGPFLLFLSDLEKSTPGWSGEERWMYLRLLTVMWSNGGYIEDDEAIIAEAMGLNRARNWREKAEKVIYKLVSSKRHSGKKTQFRLLRDLKKAKDISDKRRNAAAGKGSKCKANASPDRQQLYVPPSPSPSKEESTSKSKEDLEGASAPPGYLFEGRVIKLREDDFNRWRDNFFSGNEDLFRAELVRRDDWLATEAPAEQRRRWFMSTSSDLANKARGRSPAQPRTRMING